MRLKTVKLLIPAARSVGETDVILLPFQPQGAIFEWNGRAEVADAQGVMSHLLGVGLWTPASSSLITTTSIHAVTPSQSATQKWNGGEVGILGSAGTVIGESIATAEDNGDGTWSLVLTCDNVYAQALEVVCTVIGEVGAVDFVAPSMSTSTVLIPTPSGQADALVLVSGSVASTGAYAIDAALSIGFAARSGGQASLAVNSDNGRASSFTGGNASNAGVIVTWGSGGTVISSGAITAWNVDSIELTRSSTVVRPCFGLAIIGCNAAVVAVDTLTDIVTDINVSALGWQPAGLLSLSSGATAWDAVGVKRTTAQAILGAADASLSQCGLGVVDVNAQNPTAVGAAIAPSDIYVRQTEANPPVAAGRMRLNSVNADGLALRMSVADDVSRKVALLVLGPDTSSDAALSGGLIEATSVSPSAVVIDDSLAPSGGTPPLTRQLQRTTRGGSVWTDIVGATSAPYTDDTIAAGTDYDYRVEVTDSAGPPEVVYSNVLPVDVPELLVAGVATLGTVASNQVEASATAATGGSGVYIPQWQRTARGGSAWSNVAGQNTLNMVDTSVVPTVEYDYRLRVTDTATPPQVDYSNVIQANVPEGSTAPLSLPAQERVESIQWGSTRPIEFELTRSQDGLPYDELLSPGDVQIDVGTGDYVNVANLPVPVGGRYRWTPTASETSHEAPVVRIDLTGTLRRLIFIRTEGHPDAYYGGAEAAGVIAQNAAPDTQQIILNNVAGVLRVGDELATSGGATGRIETLADSGGGTFQVGLAHPYLRGSVAVGDSVRTYLAVRPDKTEFSLTDGASSTIISAVQSSIDSLNDLSIADLDGRLADALLGLATEAAQNAIAVVLAAVQAKVDTIPVVDGLVPTVVKKINATELTGSGTEEDPMRAV